MLDQIVGACDHAGTLNPCAFACPSMLQADEDESINACPDGPRTHDEILSWPCRCVGALCNNTFGVDFVVALALALQSGLELTTDYSGVGSAEVALAFMQEALQLLGFSTGIGRGAEPQT